MKMPIVATNDRRVVSSERAPYIHKTTTNSNKNPVWGPGRGLTPRLAGCLTVGRNVTLTLRSLDKLVRRGLHDSEICETVKYAVSPPGLGTKNNYVGDGPQQFSNQSSQLVVTRSPADNDVSTEGEESPSLGTVIKQRLMKTEDVMCAVVTVTCKLVRLL
jgi:hypothetical protein